MLHRRSLAGEILWALEFHVGAESVPRQGLPDVTPVLEEFIAKRDLEEELDGSDLLGPVNWGDEPLPKIVEKPKKRQRTEVCVHRIAPNEYCARGCD